MVPASNPGQVVVKAHLAIAGVAIGLQDALEVIEQAHRHLAAPGGVVLEQYRWVSGWTTPGYPHPFVRLGGFAILLEHLDPGFVGLEVIAAVLHFPHQVDQWFEHVIQPDDPVGHAGTADLMPQAFEHLLQPVQRQAIGVLGGDEVGPVTAWRCTYPADEPDGRQRRCARHRLARTPPFPASTPALSVERG